MSLKAFHIVFVIVATMFMAFFAAWALRAYAQTHQKSQLLLGVLAIVGSVLLLVYGKWFLKKIKNTKLA